MATESGTGRPKRRAAVTHALGEVALIVTGVLIALSLESLWQDRADRRDEQSLLEGLHEEFEENQGSLARWQELHQRVSDSSSELVGRLESAAEGDRIQLPDSLLANLGRTPTYTPSLASLDAALSSGQISLIESVEIQRALARWMRLLEDAQEEETRTAELSYSVILPRLAVSSDLGSAMSYLTEDVRRIMEGRPTEPWPATSSEVVVSRELINLVWVKYRASSAAANELEILKSGLADVLALLEEELR